MEKKVYPPHRLCACINKVSPTKTVCVCQARTCPCHGCTGARKARGA